MNYGRDTNSETTIFEFPVTVEDQAPPTLARRLGKTIAIAKAISREHGIFVLLLHPNTLGEKLEFEKQFIAAVKSFSYFTTIGTYGNWWRARNQIGIDVNTTPHTAVVRLTAPKPVKGLTIDLQPGSRLLSAQGATATQHGNQITLGNTHGTITLTLTNPQQTPSQPQP